MIETMSVVIVPSGRVTETLAALEGEGDGSLRHSRVAHRAYFGRQAKRICKEADAQMPVVCK